MGRVCFCDADPDAERRRLGDLRPGWCVYEARKRRGKNVRDDNVAFDGEREAGGDEDVNTISKLGESK